MEAIVLAGGLGTRLRGVIGYYPKCMAAVADRPFLFYLHRWLLQAGVTRVIHSLGYRHDVVEEYLKATPHSTMQIDAVVEATPLGTGGGILLAMKKAQEENVLVVNGDTFFDVPLQEFSTLHKASEAAVSLALKPMQHFERYGTVKVNPANNVLSFEEKKPMTQGLINGGVYLINRSEFLNASLPERFSLEQDYLHLLIPEKKLSAFSFDQYFIDIGVPEDFERAQQEFRNL